MKKYEIMFIVKPTLEDEATANVALEMKKILEEKGAIITEEKNLGRRELAYTVKDFNSGTYFLFNLEANDSTAIKEFDRLALISENVIKHLTIKL